MGGQRVHVAMGTAAAEGEIDRTGRPARAAPVGRGADPHGARGL